MIQPTRKPNNPNVKPYSQYTSTGLIKKAIASPIKPTKNAGTGPNI